MITSVSLMQYLKVAQVTRFPEHSKKNLLPKSETPSNLRNLLNTYSMKLVQSFPGYYSMIALLNSQKCHLPLNLFQWIFIRKLLNVLILKPTSNVLEQTNHNLFIHIHNDQARATQQRPNFFELRFLRLFSWRNNSYFVFVTQLMMFTWKFFIYFTL